MKDEIVGEATKCECGTPLDELRCFFNSPTKEICEDCYRINMDEDEEDE